MDVKSLVGANVKRLRKARGFTQEALSELAHMSQQHLSEIERGNGNPTVVTLAALAEAFGVEVMEIFLPIGD